jgi:hypothetical protein
VRAQRVQHGVVVGEARGEDEYQLRHDPESGHARVIDGAPERVVARRSGQGGARIVEHPREPGVALEFRFEPARRLRG